MIVSIHQPNYLPYFGFFDKIKKSDIFVIYDDAQFNKGDFQHRNKIRIYHGWKWLTVPVEKKHVPIKQIEIKNDLKLGGLDWSDYHFKEIMSNYEKAPYFKDYGVELEYIYSQKYDFLIDLNMDLINFLIEKLGLNTKIVFSSDFDIKSTSTEKLVDIVDTLDGDTYLSGMMGENYLDKSLFDNKGIEVVFQDFCHPVYSQQYDDFIPNMSVLDMLLNIGPTGVSYEPEKT
ncbi:hypothetical protein J2755_000385 [Methanohalophilus levihalophilus]|uniref:WbqC family protein n=1 Tax=Methanohalophilus levihalophilus TaxID=1431282 RepID=UPI001AE553DB|nr:WbqC family protein [Methanohalophilus levihalophilus]MBP2029465.1 hypothetical protein [Methanohalophilus levihalophilus]